MSTQDSRVGTFIAGKYEVLSVLGRGGLGVVYKAKQKHLERMCAVKVLTEKFSEDPNSFQRFEREARIASSLNNDNIISVFDFGLADEGYAYLVMEYAQGEDLDTILGRQGRLEPARAIPLFLCVTTALNFAHVKSVVHRDLKPSNVMISSDENGQELVKLVDFGMAKSFSEVQDNHEQLTAEGRVLGTPAYMSPEQCLGTAVDARTDIYSMGALMYKAITGFPPFSGGSVYSVMTLHVSEPPQPISAIAPDLNVGDLERVIMKCLEKEPEKRYQNAMELRADLEMALLACWSRAGGESNESSSTVLTVVPENMGDFESTHRAAQKGDPTAQYQLALVFVKEPSLDRIILNTSNG
jgi:Serine/threonine protein kinase